MQFRKIFAITAAALTMGTAVLQAAAPKGNAPRDMKLLIVAVDGTEPQYAALKFFVETLGIPYQTAFTLDTTRTPPVQKPLPALTDGNKGFFQGIILTNGNTGYCGPAAPQCMSGLTEVQWALLENYARDFGVRVASYYTFPEARYGLALPTTGTQAVSTTDATPVSVRFTGPAASIFPYLVTSSGIRITKAYVYFARAATLGAGETLTPFLTVNGGGILGALNTKADGREYMALTFDNNPSLRHSLLLNYGILNWVMKGVFIGGRKVYLTPQVDDHFLANDLFVQGQNACMPVGFVNDPTYDPAGACPTLRITGPELNALADWQTKWQQKTQFRRFRVTHAFNGFGSVDSLGNTLNDDLVQQTVALRGKFFWVNHTWDHEDLDCYNAVSNSGAATCRAATEAEAASEISKNIAQAKALGLPLDSLSMVTPGISGLTNLNVLNAAAKAGIRYLVSDTSKAGYMPATPNTGTFTFNNILLIPRRPTNLFYNTVTGATGAAGSLTDEYNYFFGPSGRFKDGSGNPFFPRVQSYADIVNTESENLLTYMLRTEIYPQMYHQSNLHLYNGKNSLFADVHEAAMLKFEAISNLPVISLTQADLGRELEARMAVLSANISGVLTPGTGVTILGGVTANVPVTGICFGSACESYGGQCLSKVPITAGSPVNMAFSAVTNVCDVNPGLSDVPAPPVAASPLSAPNAQQQNVLAAQQTVGNLLRSVNQLQSDARNLQALRDAYADASDAALWMTGDVLNPEGGRTVFAALKRAAEALTVMVKDPAFETSKSVLEDLLVSTTEISRTLANVSINKAKSAAPGSKNLDNAVKELAKANSEYSSTKYDSAIEGFGKAWEGAERAIDSIE